MLISAITMGYEWGSAVNSLYKAIDCDHDGDPNDPNDVPGEEMPLLSLLEPFVFRLLTGGNVTAFLFGSIAALLLVALSIGMCRSAARSSVRGLLRIESAGTFVFTLALLLDVPSRRA
jgi:hypothetical protein